mgnify:FL=1
MNPFVKMEKPKAKIENTLPFLKEFAWDFDKDRFIYKTDGTIQTVKENEALKVWIYKALKTERYRYEAYLHGIYNLDSNYGVELEKYIGAYPNNSRTATLIEQRIKECLSINPYIKRINYIRIDNLHKDKLTIGLSITSIYGTFEQIIR